jgi:arabinose-5-phosphate isomerase
MKNTKSSKTILANAKQILELEGKALCSFAKKLDNTFIQAVDFISKCKGRVIVLGIGKSGLVGRKVASTLASTGTPAFFVHPVECLHGDLGMFRSEDVVIAFSNSGETEELSKLIPLLKTRKIKIISITGRANSKLAKLSDITLLIKIPAEACPYNITPTTSSTAMLALGDALAISLMKMKKFGKQDFAKLHPGGSLGKLLTLKVKDIMHTGRQNPVINQDKTVRDALFVMTKTRLGATSVVNSKGKLVGFFTDGDLRRKLQKNTDILKLKLTKVMTKNPLTVAPNQLAADVAKLISGKKIDNLPVINSNKKPIGIIDEQDLIKAIPKNENKI